MSLYNFDLQLCVVMSYRVDFTLARTIAPSSAIYVASMEPYNLRIPTNLIRVVYEAIYVSLLLYFLALELWNLCVVSRGSISRPSYLTLMVVSFVQHVLHYGGFETFWKRIMLISNLRILFTQWLMAVDPKRGAFFKLSSLDEYISLLHLAQSDELFMTLNNGNKLLITVHAQ